MKVVRKLRRSVTRALGRLVPYRVSKFLNAPWTYYCPVCRKHARRFLPYGDPPRPGALCPACGSLERHRLDWVFLQQRTDFFDEPRKKLLHVAPEEFLSKRFRKLEHLEYLSADLGKRTAMVKMDITNIGYPADSFDVVYCSHVLEHVPDDRKALSELHRVLCRDGWAVLQVPITAEKTYEDPAIVDPEQRKQHFGQWDHVRRCGPDYAERMRDAGFDVQVLRATDLVTRTDCERMGFREDRLLFFCRKTSPPAGGDRMHLAPQST